MKAKHLGIQRDQFTSRSPFCLQLNALRAFACISVICTHIVKYYGLSDQFRSLAYGGHMAVYFFFALSGYLLSLSLVKEVKRRLNLDTESQDGTPPVQDREDLPLRIEIDDGEEIDQNETQDSEAKSERLALSERLRLEFYQLIALLRKTKQPLVFAVLGKYLWNRTLRLFPLYYGCWCLLKFFAREDTHVRSLQMGNLWKDILLLKIFPGHLWTMRIEMMFYYYVIPVYIICLCITFYLQKKGFKLASSVCFFSIMGALILLAINQMNLEEDIKHPVKISEDFLGNLPPFLFGMLAALVNSALEMEYNSQQIAKTKEEISDHVEEDSSLISKKDLEPEEQLSKAVSSMFQKYKWHIVCLVVFLRIVMLNPGVNKNLFTKSDEIPKWQMANLNSYWYAIFILINDTRGGFWKLMQSKSKSQRASLPSSFFSKIIYYFGLWSYPIYLTHPISYVTLYYYFEKPQGSLEMSVLSILGCLALGGFADFVIDKILVNKLILGKILTLKKN